jgi:hypothetical protein
MRRKHDIYIRFSIKKDIRENLVTQLSLEYVCRYQLTYIRNVFLKTKRRLALKRMKERAFTGTGSVFITS